MTRHAGVRARRDGGLGRGAGARQLGQALAEGSGIPFREAEWENNYYHFFPQVTTNYDLIKDKSTKQYVNSNE